MTAYTDHPDTIFDPLKPVLGSTGLQARDNLLGVLDTGTNAPVNSATWHPYDMARADDGADGKIYDYSTDGGVNSIETPDFEDGFEYLLIGEDMSHNINDGLDHTFELFLYAESTSAYVSAGDAGTGVLDSEYMDFEALIRYPRMSRKSHFGPNGKATTATAAGKILKAKLQLPSGSTDRGKVYMMKRRVYV